MFLPPVQLSSDGILGCSIMLMSNNNAKHTQNNVDFPNDGNPVTTEKPGNKCVLL